MNMPLVLLNRRRRGGAAAFTPAGLFALAEPGVWYDPSDLTTLFQDTAGTLPVTTPGQTVALALDKSKGLVLGPELVTNGTFDTDTSGWTSWQTGVLSVDSSRLKVENGAATISGAYQIITVVVGRTYKFEGVREPGPGAASPRYYLGTSIGGTQYVSGAVSGQVFVATSTTLVVTAATQTTTLGAIAYFDNISVKELPGFHATQATLASRPTYGIVPLGGRRNLLVNTTTMATQSLTVTAVAHTLSFTGTGTVTLTGASTAGPLVGTGVNNRVSLTFTPTAASLTLTVSGSVTLAQLELGSTVSNYQRVGSAFDVTEAGVSSLSYLAFDGVDDWLVTPTITPGIDRAQVFAGVRKLSDVAQGMVAEFSANSSANNGSFFFIGPRTNATANYGFNSRGTIAVDATSPANFAAPITNVLTAIGDIAGDVARLRVNGSQVAETLTDQGTGNFLAYPLYIGRRGGSALPFNGNLFSIIVRFGTNLDAGTITSTETWVAGKTGVTL